MQFYPIIKEIVSKRSKQQKNTAGNIKSYNKPKKYWFFIAIDRGIKKNGRPYPQIELSFPDAIYSDSKYYYTKRE